MRGLMTVMALMMLLVGSGCDAVQDTALPADEQPAPAGAADDYAVWSAVLAEWYPPGTGVQTILLADHTDSMPLDADEVELPAYFRGQLPDLAPATWRDYRQRRTTAVPLQADRFDRQLPGAPVCLIGDAELRELFAAPRGWETLHARYPRSSGIVALSLPGYNENRTEALLSFSSTMGPLAGSGHLVMLARRPGGWQVVARAKTWIS
ncbi:MAG TPA: hypothetical protein PKM88_00630 [bacterium]|nr:hypothetical protein [bacterium]